MGFLFNVLVSLVTSFWYSSEHGGSDIEGFILFVVLLSTFEIGRLHRKINDLKGPRRL